MQRKVVSLKLSRVAVRTKRWLLTVIFDTNTNVSHRFDTAEEALAYACEYDFID